jgi:hypothetical protein
MSGRRAKHKRKQEQTPEQFSRFERGVLKNIPSPEQMSRTYGITVEEARDRIERLKRDEIWINNLYQVNVSYPNDEIIHLSIKRRDKKPIHDWRHLQWIKTIIVGPENEGIELYPAESRVVDTANQYHLWVFRDPTFRFPVGYNEGRMVDYTKAKEIGGDQRDEIKIG